MAPVRRAVLGFARIRDRRHEEPRTPGAPVIHSGDQVVQDGRVWALRPHELGDQARIGAVPLVHPSSRRSAIPACSMSARATTLRLKNFSGSR
jgi:hypothetical protein